MRDGNWPTALHSKAAARMARSIGPRLETEIKPAIAAVSQREHKWGLYAFLAAGGAGLITIFGYKNWEPIGHLALALSAIVNFKVFGIYNQKNRALKTARAVLDGLVNEDLFSLSQTEIEAHSPDNPISLFDAAGFFSPYDQIHHLHSLGPIDKDGRAHPLMTHTRMTRTEVERDTDSRGNTQTRTRIVEVFHGVMLTLDVPGPIDDSRILISSRRVARPRGIFQRRSLVGGRKRDAKMKTLKPASPRFNKLFTVKGDDQMETHEFLDPDRVMRWLNLVDDLLVMFGEKGENLSVLITRGKAYIAIETGPLMSVKDFTGTAEEMESQFETMAGQLTLPHIIAEHLKLTPPPRYEWDKDKDAPSEERLV